MKRVLILGASSELGKHLAFEFASNGYNIILTSRNLNEIKKISKKIDSKYSVECNYFYFDILHDVADELIKKIKIIPDIIISTVGFNEQHWLETNYSNWKNNKFNEDIFHKILSTNFTYIAILIENLILLSLNNKKNLSLIILTSVAGIRGRSKNYVYGAAKSALIEYLSGLRQRYSRNNIKIMTVIPGYIKTNSLSYRSMNSTFAISPERLANIIYKSHKKEKDIVYGPYWYLLSILIKLIPESIFKFLRF